MDGCPLPRFSVIVPAYKVQAYLHECLESVLSQSFADLELIVVDDRSPDACGEIADEFAARDARVRAVHLPENVGLGRARNAGLERATGDYLLFLDSDDTLTPDALRAIADRVEETGEPDVLVYDYASTYWSGETVRNQFAAQLTEEGPAPFRLQDRPGLLRVLMVAWNKAYRREFVERVGLTFPPGFYEDTPWTYPALMAARTLATLDRVCVHYRQRRRGNILSTTSRGHFDVFEQYDRVFAFVEQRPELACWRPVLFRRMVDHLSTVFTKRDRLPPGSRAEFLRRARAHYRRYRTPGAPVPLRSRLRHTLVHFGVHRTYRALQATMTVHGAPTRPSRNSPASSRQPSSRPITASSCGCRCAPTVPCSRPTGAAATAATRARWRPRSAPSRHMCARRGSPAPSTGRPSRRARGRYAPGRPRTGRRWPAPSTW